MADYSFAVRQHSDIETTRDMDRFYLEVFDNKNKKGPSVLCEVRKTELTDEYEIIVWKGDKLVMGGEVIPRKSLEDLVEAITGIL
jgi:hypothetical protein